MARIRLDQLLTQRGMARSVTEAQALIHAGEVELDGTRR
ncbi:MAG: TlyA family rRNA (cytidine-2'-O)-methyltransferase, partial [Chloroflexi bacterium]|nr:TlyA family rRNA (cytidine-2'-O)-methyltransferase [Chloroflexota bacterium]